MHDPAAPAWTDANAHDPGVTLLEALAFAVSALGVAASGRRIWRKLRTPPRRDDD